MPGLSQSVYEEASEHASERDHPTAAGGPAGGGFNTSLVVDGVVIRRQKVVAFENDVVYTVNRNGLARATRIERIDSVDF